MSLAELTTPSIKSLVADLMETMEAASRMGIAAPQIGVSKRVFVVASKPNNRYPHAPLTKPTAMVNPVLKWESSEVGKGYEGCLSVPGIRGLVPRARQIQVSFTEPETAQELVSEYRDFIARIWVHENDHLDGLMFLDRTSSYELISDKEFYKLLEAQARSAV